MIIHINNLLDTDHKYICISRPRRFGKTLSANMIAAYYDINGNAKETFKDLKIIKHESFDKFANKYIVIKITIQTYLSLTHDVDLLINKLKKDITDDLLKQYGYTNLSNDLNELMKCITLSTWKKFVIVIDEWDCILREFKDNQDWHEKYLDFLRYWFKDQDHIALVYMTGILPIKKYGTHSALNMFDEYSMLAAYQFNEFIGFTESEVQDLCTKYAIDFSECKRWYDGYKIQNFKSIYNPRSVNQCINLGEFGTYWNNTETYEALKFYITMDKGDLHDKITNLLANNPVKINTNTFTNDMKTFSSPDDILTLLVHLGYLTYDHETSSVTIPNQEIAIEFVNSIQGSGWPLVTQAIENSKNLLAAVLNGDCSTVAQGIEAAHFETSILSYNDENALAATISLAFYAAREFYTIVREFPTGKGFADLVFLPRPKCTSPILLIELKYDQSATAAIEQILNRKYPNSLINHAGEILLVGINYDKKSKNHTCSIQNFKI